MKLSLPDYNQANVLVVGDVMLDRYWYGPTGRISPEAPCQWSKLIKRKSALVGLPTWR